METSMERPKDTGNTTIDDDDRPANMHVCILTSDGVSIDAWPIRRYSILLEYYYDGIMEMDACPVTFNSATLEKIKDFCEGLEKIEGDKLQAYYFKFLKDNSPSAIELVIAAIEMKIGILANLMMKGVDRLFRMPGYEEDDVYKLFPVNLKEYDDKKFERMNLHLTDRGVFRRDNNKDWNRELLRMTFSQYKAEGDHKKRHKWLQAHFYLRNSSVRYSAPFFKAKDFVTEEGTPLMAFRNIKIIDDNIMKKRGSSLDDDDFERNSKRPLLASY